MSSGIAEAWRTCRTSSASVDHWLYALVSYSVSQCTREIGVRIMRSLLYSTSATDALSFAATSFTLIAVALLALVGEPTFSSLILNGTLRIQRGGRRKNHVATIARRRRRLCGN